MYERSEYMNKKILFLNIFVSLSIILTGCWNAMELNALGITLVLGGVDFENDKIILTAEVIEPAPAKEKKAPLRRGGCCYLCARNWGDNIFDAFRDITLNLIEDCILLITK